MLHRTYPIAGGAALASAATFFFLLLPLSEAFASPSQALQPPSSSSSLSMAKGFGKSSPKPKKKQASPSSPEPTRGEASESSSSAPLESIDGGGTYIPISDTPLEIDPNAPVEERTEKILKERWGLKTYEEVQGDMKAAEKAKERKEKYAKFKAAAKSDKDIDFFALVPAPVLKAIDTFLKVGLSITTVLFVAAGIGITAEAWSTATGKPLPGDIDNFIVNVVEPNFTPALLVLLGFSVTLGLFAAGQLGSESSQYSEDT